MVTVAARHEVGLLVSMVAGLIMVAWIALATSEMRIDWGLRTFCSEPARNSTTDAVRLSKP